MSGEPPSLKFHKSSFCHHGNCVEVAQRPDGRWVVRDGKDDRADAPVLIFSSSEWAAFVSGVKNGEFD